MTEDSGKTRALLAGMVLLSLITINLVLIYKTPTDDFTKTQLNTLNGALILQLGIVMAFYFGTSSGAKTLSAAQAETTKSVVEHQQELTKAAVVAATGPLAGKDTPTGKKGDPIAVTEEAPAEDDGLASFKELAKKMNPNATDEQIDAAWAQLKAAKVDIKL